MQSELTYAWLGPITLVEKGEDGSRYVYGIATDGTLDADEQIVDPAFAKKAMSEWYEVGNVRQMHSTNLAPAGKGVLLESKSDGEYVRTKVVEPTAIKLVDEGVYTGYSVGISRPKIIRDAKAPNGRIVGGKIVEISLVDRPANPVAKFMLAKRATPRGALEFVGKSVVVPMLTKQAPSTEASVADETKVADSKECMKCKGAGQFDGSDCPACGGTGKAPPDEAEKTWPPAKDDEGKDAPAADGDKPSAAADGPPEKPAPVDESEAQPAEKTFPPPDDAEAEKHHEEHDIVVIPADKAGKAKAKKTFPPKKEAPQEGDTSVDAAPAEQVGDDGDEDDAAKSARIDGDALPFVLRRLHDVTCAAYKSADILDQYPTVEQHGIASALGPSVRKSVYNMLTERIRADKGAGAFSGELQRLAQLYDALGGFEPKGDGKDPFLKARNKLHAAFLEANKMEEGGGPSYPSPSETITAGQYRRPYLSAGHQRESAKASPPNIPSTTHPIDAKDFTRGAITEGQQRSLKLAAAHDAVSSWHPEICLMQLQDFDGNGYAAFVRQPDDPFVARLNAKTTSTPVPSEGLPTQKAPGEKRANGNDDEQLNKITGISTEWLEEVIAKAIRPYTKQIKELQRKYDEMAAMPDPTRAALRGAAGNGVAKVANKVSYAEEAQREAEQRAKSAEVEYLRSLARSGNPETRLSAEKRLTKLGVELD